MADNLTFTRITPEQARVWSMVRDVCDGGQVVRNYLPMLNGQDMSADNVSRNNAYRERAVFYEVTSFTLAGLVGLAFRVDPRINLPTALEGLIANADGAGTSIYQQAQIVLSHVLQVGRHGLLVETVDHVTVAIRHYAAESIINWRTEMVANREVLTLVVLREEVDSEGEFEIAREVRYRELRLVDGLVRSRVWGMKGDAPTLIEEVWPTAQTRKMDFIPFVFVGSQSNTATVDPAPLKALASLNLAHYRNSADYEDSVFFVGQVQPVIAGLNEQWRDWLTDPVDAEGRPTGRKMYVGSRTPLMLPEGASFSYAQAQPNTLVAEAMASKETQMMALGARLLTTQSTMTATQSNSQREASTSILAMCCANVTEGYQQVVRYACAIRGITLSQEEAAGSFKLNQDFIEQTADPAMLSQLVAAWQSRAIAKKDMRDALRRVNLIAAERTDEQIDEEIDAEGPALANAERE